MQPSRPSLLLRSSLVLKLGLVALVFGAAIATVHVLSLDRLAHVSTVSNEVRNRWLDSLRSLGNVSDRISGVRMAEAELLLNRDRGLPDMRSATLHQSVKETENAIDRYRGAPHDPSETLAFDNFLRLWREHLNDLQRVESFVQGGQIDQGVSLFNGSARSSFQAAESELYRLIDATETRAEAARNLAVHAIADAQRWVSDLILAMLMLFVALATYFWRSVSRPLLQLAGLMQRLASNDTNFSVPFDRRRDEVGEMARSLAVFRRNTIELLESRKSLSRQAEVLAGALDKERALATEQRNFITTMSHEFRTPLTSIDGNAQRLIATKDRTTPAQIADRAQRIRAAVFRMTSLVVSLTGAMEMTNGPIQPRTRRFDLSTMLRDLARYYREIGLGEALEEQIDDLPEGVNGDPELLHYAFSNLISNAFKYSPGSGIVALTAKEANGFVEVTVEDHGVGIPPAEIDRVCERFYRGSNVGSIPGTGVGLHLVNQIVGQHGGRLRIESEVGRGTRMTVSLPIGNADPPPSERLLEQNFVRRGRRGDSEPSDGGSERPRLHS